MTCYCIDAISTEAADPARWALEKPAFRGALEDVAIRAAARAGTGLRAMFGSRVGAAVGILMYHRVATNPRGLPKPSFNVSPRQFRRQLIGLRKRGYTFWPLRKVLDHHARGAGVPPRTVVVTFDDGFETVATRAWPVLRELDVPATVFVSTAYLDSQQPYPFDTWGRQHHDRVAPESYRPMTSEQCRRLGEDRLIELGAHTHTHQDFRGRSEAFRTDLEQSVDVMRSQFGLDDVTFAFPYGSTRQGFAGGELTAAARQSGVLCSLTTDARPVDADSDPFDWGRFNVFAWDSPATLAARLDGWYGWAPALRHRLARSLHHLRRGRRPRLVDSLS
jgi:peptidoglycan/xylan/chitin deacetylase (PgdA/CDA1 family)